MSDPVKKVFGLDTTKGDIGIEIEVEGNRLPHPERYIGNLWRVERDGSLRGESYEYVLNSPVPIGEVNDAIKILKKEFKRCKSKVDNSIRAGVHVHVNVQELSMVQLATFITCYFAIEEVLITFCSPSRKGNHFCLRAKDAEYLLWRINNFFETGNIALSDDIRYSAINLVSLKKYGSLEFRALETPQDFSKVKDWAEILYALKENSLNYSSPVEVIESMSMDGYSIFLQELLGKHASIFAKKNVEELILQGVRNAQNIAYGIDWGNYDKMKLKKKALKTPVGSDVPSWAMGPSGLTLNSAGSITAGTAFATEAPTPRRTPRSLHTPRITNEMIERARQYFGHNRDILSQDVIAAHNAPREIIENRINERNRAREQQETVDQAASVRGFTPMQIAIDEAGDIPHEFWDRPFEAETEEDEDGS